MSAESRPVDQAMNAERPEKQKIRSIWIDEIKSVAEDYPDSDIPWYLTLPGSEGHDIQLLIDEGLIELTEVDSIAESSQRRVVAVEHNDEAVLNLQRKFVGLPIREFNFQHVIRGDSLFAWPDGEDREFCKSRIINLDLNTILKCNTENDSVTFPIFEWIKKLCHIHADPENINWTLCLTLHGEINWPDNVVRFSENFLKDNFQREPEFENLCEEFLGCDLHQRIKNNQIDIGELDWPSQQKYLMVFVPKYIANMMHTDGWKVKTEYNLRYGGSNGTAPMVTWIIKFEVDQEYAAQPNQIYRESLITILQRIGIINQDGNIE